MSLKGIFEEKRKWKAFMVRVEKLPEDYKIVYKEIQKYLFKVGPVDVINQLISIIELFEEGVISHKKVLEITGKDVAAFCDELIKDSKTYAEIYMETYNQKVVDKTMKRKGEK